MASKRYASVDRAKCVACGACESTCPMGTVRVHKGCYAMVEEDKCIGCGKCKKVCPANAIVIKDRVSI